MKKDIYAAIMLVLLFAASLVNIHCLGKLTGTIAALSEQAGLHAASGEWQLARDSVSKARENWKKYEDYTNMVLRHSEINDVDSVLGDLLKAVYEENAAQTEACAIIAADRLRCVTAIEKIRLGSIF